MAGSVVGAGLLLLLLLGISRMGGNGRALTQFRRRRRS